MKFFKKKEKKPSALKRKCDGFVKEYLCENAVTNGYTVQFEQENGADFFSLKCMLNYGDFTVIIRFGDSSVLLENFNIDFDIAYKDCERTFSIYDIFNLFDIQDFGFYYYDDCIDENSIAKALGEITALINKYYGDIKRADSQTYLPILIRQRNDDIKKANGDDYDEEDVFDLSVINYLKTTARTREKLIDNLASSEDDELVLYEKRLLKYLKDGNDVKYASSHKNEYESVFKKMRSRVHAISFFAVFFAVMLMELVIYKVNFSGAFIPMDAFVLGLPFQLVILLAGAVLAGVLFVITIGRLLVRRLCPEEAQGYIKAYYQRTEDGSKADRIMNRFVMPVGFSFLIVLFLAAGNINAGFFEDYVKIYYSPADIQEFRYEDIELVRILNQGTEGDYEPYEDICYAIVWDGDYYALETCEENSRTDIKIKEISSKYNKEIKRIDNHDALAEKYSEE